MTHDILGRFVQADSDEALRHLLRRGLDPTAVDLFIFGGGRFLSLPDPRPNPLAGTELVWEDDRTALVES